ncbi:cupin domain-containing protein [Thermoflexus sp.]|uniref:cupin domain-containing protein n=1 Tax=Thermoflexus sp. TaxID=1969742 RepID=UPI0025E41F3C|nr:cupin domain-containing protein [Thermoflexus sp.]MDW8180953.1 cupin domain-containing protein [Anaerolineae bacterium]MCS6963971.1 cupin domain-containing protein [Thermoflexus sp.]MCS7351496.1 cupin domain-containing protein [Thermoflexus sp.]MCX7691065.1 cupin domain-containing protein [Thermoflexus sp.]MDW8185337.1 cupin domain-containing protein [Anaerolineae bacterium]
MIFRASIPEIRESLAQPFQVYPIARFGTVHVYAYRSYGEVTRHRHPEFDEVFLIYEGLVTFWTDREELTLKPDELIWIPRGMAHRSGSRVPSLVLLFRKDFMPERRNGDFRISDPTVGSPITARIHERLRAYPDFTPALLLEADAVRYHGLRGNGSSPEWKTQGPTFLLLLRGEIAMEAGRPDWPEPVRGILAPGELAVLPPGTRWRWTSRERSVLLWVEDMEAHNSAQEQG